VTSQWCETTLGDICDKVCGTIQTGPFGSQLHESDYSQEGTPVVMPKDIIEGRILIDSVARIAPEHVERLSRHKLKPGDIVYGRRGDIGRQALIRKEQDGWLCGTGCLRLSLSDTVIEPLFLHYYLRQESVIGWISNQAVGATLPNLNTGILRSVPVRVPPLPVQRRIVGILSTYDDLIENNRRRIKLLEEMARSLYREWFVHFRFPGHAKVKMVPSTLGTIPQGWEVKPLGELAMVTMGLSPKGNTYNEEEVGTPLVNGPVEFGDRFTKRMKWTTEPTKFCKEGDLVVCVRGSTTGKYVKSDGVYCLGRGVCGISSKYQCFIELLFENELPTLLGQTSGSTFPSWTGPQLKFHPVLSPPPEVLARFDGLVKPMSAAVLGCSRQIQNLRRTRDLLLPRLLSGQPIRTVN
jgi:type I restriction enzyme S subunit